MNITIRDGLTYDDVLLVPQHSKLKSRSEVDISVKLDKFTFNHPIIPANMKTVTGLEMALINSHGHGLSLLHRFMPIEEQLKIAEDMVDEFNLANYFGVSLGVKFEDKENVAKFNDCGIKIVCIDIAHGDSVQCIEMISFIKSKFPNLFIIAGNVATSAGARRLWDAGADVVKVGIGPGSLCTTRIETGNGVPQLTAIMDVAAVKKSNEYMIADGGIKHAGDIVKALCFADMVMVGNLLAGCDESPGTIVNLGKHSYKEYVGSSTHKTNHIEGVAAMVPHKGSYYTVTTKLIEGLKSGCSYQGCHNLSELKEFPEFVKISNAGLVESHPHDIIL